MLQIIVFVFLSFVLFSCKAQSNHLPEKLILSSAYLSRADTVLVFLPQKFDKASTKKYPLVYLLHGWSGNYRQWSKIADLQKYADDYGFLLVCPDGLHDSWYLNSANQGYENFFFRDLLPTIESKYPIDTKNIFLTGVSMGGYGAFSLFLKKTNYFNSVSATSALFDLQLFPTRFGLPKIISNNEKQAWETLSIHGQMAKSKPKNPIYFDCGTEDAFYQDNVKFGELCKKIGLNSVFVYEKGNHDKNYWEKMLNGHFEFFKKQLQQTKK
jgi:putative tributyrin esterase